MVQNNFVPVFDTVLTEKIYMQSNAINSEIIGRKSIYLGFLILSYVMVMMMANWFDPRLIKIFGLTTDAGTLIFTLTFLLSDVITEVYGFKQARRAILCGFLFNVLFIVYGQIVIHMPSPDFSTNNQAFNELFGTNIRIIIASGISYLISEPLNSILMAKLKEKWEGEYIGARFLISTFIASGLDSIIFGFIAFFNIISNEDLSHLILTMFIIKVIIEIAGLPISVRLSKKLKEIEKLDIYDKETNFNMFTLDAKYTEKDNEFNKRKNKSFLIKPIQKDIIK